MDHFLQHIHKHIKMHPKRKHNITLSFQEFNSTADVTRRTWSTIIARNVGVAVVVSSTKCTEYLSCVFGFSLVNDICQCS